MNQRLDEARLEPFHKVGHGNVGASTIGPGRQIPNAVNPVPFGRGQPQVDRDDLVAFAQFTDSQARRSVADGIGNRAARGPGQPHARLIDDRLNKDFALAPIGARVGNCAGGLVYP